MTLTKALALNALSKQLYAEGFVDSSLKFKWATKLLYNYSKFQAGHYLIEKGDTPENIVEKFESGKSYSPVILSIVIPEGFTVKKIVNRLEANGLGSKKEIQALMNDRKFMKSLNVPAKSFEGSYILQHTATGRKLRPSRLFHKW